MPSSPEVLAGPPAVRPVELVELGESSTPRSQPTLFEVAAQATLPDELVAQARRQAQAAGYLAGWTSGLRAAEARAAAITERARVDAETARAGAAQRRARAMAALDGAVSAFERAAAPVAEDLEETILALAFDIAEAIVGSTLRDGAGRAPAALARALALAPDNEHVTVRLHPADLEVLEGDSGAAAPAGRTVTLLADASLAPGDAVAETAALRVDARLAGAVERVRQVLQP